MSLRFSGEFWQQLYVRATDKIHRLIDNIDLCRQCHFESYFEQLSFKNRETMQETEISALRLETVENGSTAQSYRAFLFFTQYMATKLNWFHRLR